MTPKIKYKWFAFIVIWCGCFLLCFFNIDTINTILDNREIKEILRMDMEFWKQNSKNISKVIEQQRLLNHEVESLKLGIVFLNDAFNGLASDFSLDELRVEMDSKQSQNDSMPVRTSFKCNLKNGLNAIRKIQAEYAFLPFRSVKIEEAKEGIPAKFDILLDYKYFIADSQ